MRKPVLLTAMAIALGMASPVSAMTCSKAADVVERAICADDALKRQDEELNKAYGQARDLIGPRSSAPMVREQRAWLRDRAAKCGSSKASEVASCVRDMTGSRVKAIGQLEALTEPGRRIDVGPYTLVLERGSDRIVDMVRLVPGSGGPPVAEAVAYGGSGFDIDGRFRAGGREAVHVKESSGSQHGEGDTCALLVEGDKGVVRIGLGEQYASEDEPGCAIDPVEVAGAVEFRMEAKPGIDADVLRWEGGTSLRRIPGPEWRPAKGGTLADVVGLATKGPSEEQGEDDGFLSPIENEAFYDRVRLLAGDDWRPLARGFATAQADDSKLGRSPSEAEAAWSKAYTDKFDAGYVILRSCYYNPYQHECGPTDGAFAIVGRRDGTVYLAMRDPRSGPVRTYPDRDRWPPGVSPMLRVWECTTATADDKAQAKCWSALPTH